MGPCHWWGWARRRPCGHITARLSRTTSSLWSPPPSATWPTCICCVDVVQRVTSHNGGQQESVYTSMKWLSLGVLLRLAQPLHLAEMMKASASREEDGEQWQVVLGATLCWERERMSKRRFGWSGAPLESWRAYKAPLDISVACRGVS
jgi:hypothetical protein